MSRNALYATILVGYDGSENSRRALDKGIELARQSKGELRIAVVADTLSSASYIGAGPVYKQFADRTRMNAKNLAESAAHMAKDAGVANVYASAEEGQPADMILTLASEYKADLIVLGRRGIRGVTRFVMGSVSSAVINNAKSDVLVVK